MPKDEGRKWVRRRIGEIREYLCLKMKHGQWNVDGDRFPVLEESLRLEKQSDIGTLFEHELSVLAVAIRRLV